MLKPECGQTGSFRRRKWVLSSVRLCRALGGAWDNLRLLRINQYRERPCEATSWRIWQAGHCVRLSLLELANLPSRPKSKVRCALNRFDQMVVAMAAAWHRRPCCVCTGDLARVGFTSRNLGAGMHPVCTHRQLCGVWTCFAPWVASSRLAPLPLLFSAHAPRRPSLARAPSSRCPRLVSPPHRLSEP